MCACAFRSFVVFMDTFILNRTGTYCVVATCLENYESGEPQIDLTSTLRDMRAQRAGMVQSVAQYELCHQAIADALLQVPTDERGRTPVRRVRWCDDLAGTPDAVRLQRLVAATALKSSQTPQPQQASLSAEYGHRRGSVDSPLLQKPIPSLPQPPPYSVTDTSSMVQSELPPLPPKIQFALPDLPPKLHSNVSSEGTNRDVTSLKESILDLQSGYSSTSQKLETMGSDDTDYDNHDDNQVNNDVDHSTPTELAKKGMTSVQNETADVTIEKDETTDQNVTKSVAITAPVVSMDEVPEDTSAATEAVEDSHLSKSSGEQNVLFQDDVMSTDDRAMQSDKVPSLHLLSTQSKESEPIGSFSDEPLTSDKHYNQHVKMETVQSQDMSSVSDTGESERQQTEDQLLLASTTTATTATGSLETIDQSTGPVDKQEDMMVDVAESGPVSTSKHVGSLPDTSQSTDSQATASVSARSPPIQPASFEDHVEDHVQAVKKPVKAKTFIGVAPPSRSDTKVGKLSLSRFQAFSAPKVEATVVRKKTVPYKLVKPPAPATITTIQPQENGASQTVLPLSSNSEKPKEETNQDTKEVVQQTAQQVTSANNQRTTQNVQEPEKEVRPAFKIGKLNTSLWESQASSSGIKRAFDLPLKKVPVASTYTGPRLTHKGSSSTQTRSTSVCKKTVNSTLRQDEKETNALGQKFDKPTASSRQVHDGKQSEEVTRGQKVEIQAKKDVEKPKLGSVSSSAQRRDAEKRDAAKAIGDEMQLDIPDSPLPTIRKVTTPKLAGRKHQLKEKQSKLSEPSPSIELTEAEMQVVAGGSGGDDDDLISSLLGVAANEVPKKPKITTELTDEEKRVLDTMGQNEGNANLVDSLMNL